jgi:hypothetical protein
MLRSYIPNSFVIDYCYFTISTAITDLINHYVVLDYHFERILILIGFSHNNFGDQ